MMDFRLKSVGAARDCTKKVQSILRQGTRLVENHHINATAGIDHTRTDAINLMAFQATPRQHYSNRDRCR